MKFITAILLTAMLAFVGGLWFGWWIIAIAAFLIALLIHQGAGKAFLAGAIGVFLLWGILAWWIDMKMNKDLQHRSFSRHCEQSEAKEKELEDEV